MSEEETKSTDEENKSDNKTDEQPIKGNDGTGTFNQDGKTE